MTDPSTQSPGERRPQRAVAFLRAINVGGRRVTKDQLIAPIVALGHTDVSTFLASGNVVFSCGPRTETTPAGSLADTVADDIADALAHALGYEVPTTVRAGAELRALAAAEPFAPTDLGAAGAKPQMALLYADPDHDAAAEVLAMADDDNRLVFGPGVLHWLPRNGVSGSELDLKQVARLVGPFTVRTANTITRLVGKL